MFGIFYAILVVWISSQPGKSIQDVYFQGSSSDISPSEEFIAVLNACASDSIKKWKSDFHECFRERKYGDGGRDFKNIVDRILRHSEECVETTDKDCRPDYDGFKLIVGEVLEQMKDYSTMYLEEIHSGRDEIKDLKCVEDTLSMSVYEKCFDNLSRAINQSEYEIQSAVNNGIKCTNRENIECSKEARASLNRIVRTFYGMEPPTEEEEMEEKPEPPPPKMWYDYIAEPFITAWNAVKNFFTGIFG